MVLYKIPMEIGKLHTVTELDLSGRFIIIRNCKKIVFR